MLAALSLFPPPSVVPIEQAFLSNSCQLVGELISKDGPVQISLPEPVSISDFVSAGQARLIFGRIFSDFRTSEFYVDPRLTTYPERRGGILRARWSFTHKKTGLTSVFRIYFYVLPVIVRRPHEPGKFEPGLRIVEIRAEKT